MQLTDYQLKIVIDILYKEQRAINKRLENCVHTSLERTNDMEYRLTSINRIIRELERERSELMKEMY